MAMRDLITGSTACPDPSSSSSSTNPLNALANALIGSYSIKTQERLQEIPTSTPTGPPFQQFYSETPSQLPGSELDKPFLDSNSQGSEFLHRFRSAGGGDGAVGLEDTWDEIQREGGVSHTPIPQLRGPVPQLHQPTLDGTPQRVLSSFLHSFLDSSRGGIPFHPAPLPSLGLSEGDKQCIRDRSSIMARHLFADKSEEFIDAQVNALLCSLDIDSNAHAKERMPERFRELEDYWNESQGNTRLGARASDGWIAEYGQHREKHDNPDSWANSFEQQYGVNGWVSEFEHSQLSSVDQMRGTNMSNFAAMEQTRMLANTLAQNGDPKFQNSKFLQFVSKMSRGELIIDDNQVKESALPASGDWAAEYQQQYNHGHAWAGEFLNDKVSHGPDQWANEFTTERQQHGLVDDQWVNQFSKLHVNDWAEEFGQQIGEGAFGENSSDSWAHAYDEFLNEQVAAKQQLDSSRGVYVFSDLNPYVGHLNPLKEGQDLFRKGLLSEAVLALEAEVLKNPENAEGWRLLGIAHAENDDDQQAIAAMMRAQEADSTNLEVLLALGVSHTNELEQTAALKYLYGWLRHHPKYGALAPPEMSNSLYYADVARLFNEAAEISPDDADVHIVLGVLYNLSREYDRAIASFQRALKLKPQDYSLWNKLGATQANSVQSADAIMAYQQALDLKPNYVRAWANMGISYANQGLYEESIRYYVRALAMNPKAENAWQYLRISLSCASRNDLFEACDSRNLDLLQKEFPLQGAERLVK
ncbi:peroxisome biogenesis protein 5 [Gastrolobium bilobum]|uniref:peroxisome biogenesis protein 5 n=1 Tax=Gastrolobium bilobum TaxID=150636 RepID=UPI002AAF3B2C|nr:peroxisome biogenesis protein 5 [Gastrolobium bilobum]